MVAAPSLVPFYDPAKSYQDNFEHGPFGFVRRAQHLFPLRQLLQKHQFFRSRGCVRPFGIPAGGRCSMAPYVKGCAGTGVSTFRCTRRCGTPQACMPSVAECAGGGRLRGELKTGASAGDEGGLWRSAFDYELFRCAEFLIRSSGSRTWAAAVKHAGVGTGGSGELPGGRSQRAAVWRRISRDFIAGGAAAEGDRRGRSSR